MANRTHPVLVATRVTAPQRALIEAAAKAKGMTITELVREALLPVARQAIEDSLGVLGCDAPTQSLPG